MPNTNYLKIKLFSILVDNLNSYVSCRDIQKIIKIPVSKIYEQINTLKNEGIIIESTNNQHFKLKDTNELNDFSPTYIEYLIKGNDFFNNIAYFNTTDSTQSVAKKYALKNTKQGFVVIADYQNFGKGRQERHWVAPKEKNLLFSFLIRPNCGTEYVNLINLAIATVIRSVLAKNYKINAELKWPNDILVNEKKICGILSESACTSLKIIHTIIGVGINVNMDYGSFDNQIKDSATSLLLETESGGPISRTNLLVSILKEASTMLQLFNNESSINKILDEYKKNCATIGKKIIIFQNNKTLVGDALDISNQGALVVRINGETKCFFATDITHVRNK